MPTEHSLKLHWCQFSNRAVWNSRAARCLLILTSLAACAAGGQNGELGLRVPAGFEVTEFADSRLANDIFSMTVDPQGRVVVSGRGYIRILVDEDHDGKADRAIAFADGPRDGAMGLLWEGSTLYFTGDGGLRRYRDENGDDQADGPSELIRSMKTGGEHHAHAIRRGPDGWLYVLCGNNTGIDHTYAQLPTSPIKVPVAGCVLRFTPDLKGCEIVADGYRNAYDMDFNPDGELFTFDSDNERCVSLPWYESTRFYHVIPGGHHGWQAPQRAAWWRFPPYFCDVVAPLAYLGRGSPTGVACYRHIQFPPKYRGGMFLLDWTFGKVYFCQLERSEATYRTKKDVFIEAVGDNGFAPTDIVVHPRTGDVYISIGGRGTRGAVYRVRYRGTAHELDQAELVALEPRAPPLEWDAGGDTTLIRQATGGDPPERLQALLAIRRHRDRLRPEQIRQVVQANWDQPDRYIRKAASDLVTGLREPHRRLLAGCIQTPLEELTYCLGIHQADPAEVIRRTTRLIGLAEARPPARLAAVRLLQKALSGLLSPRVNGTIWEGYTLRRDATPLARASRSNGHPERTDRVARDVRQLPQVLTDLRGAFPSGYRNLDRELSRTLAAIGDPHPATLHSVAAQITADSSPVEDIHYLTVLARLGAARPPELTAQVARGLLELDRKITSRGLNRDRHWPLRIAELHAELARRDPQLGAAVLADQQFGRPDHVLLAHMPGFDRRKAAEIFVARAEADQDYPWSPALVDLLASLPESRARPVLRQLWENPALQESVLWGLARNPRAGDREKFLQGLGSPYLTTVELCLAALERLPPTRDGAHLLPLISTLRRLPDGREEDQLRQRTCQLLARLTGHKNLGVDRHAWTGWFARTYPDLASRIGGPAGVDVAAWEKRLEKLNWSVGDPQRGQSVFSRVACVSCHSGARRLGPDLRGVARRFSREDLFAAILQPNRDVSPRYQTTLIATNGGRLYQGTVIYEAVDGLILQTGSSTTVRIRGDQIAARRFTQTSLMPAGSLEELSDREIADLYAYLKTLRD